MASKLGEKEQAIYDSYMADMSKHDPDSFKFLSGKDPAWAYEQLKNEPDFNDFAAIVHGATQSTGADNWAKQHPVLAALNSPAAQLPSKAAGAIVGGMDDIINHIGGSSLNEGYNKGATAFNKVIEDGSSKLYDIADQMALGDTKTPLQEHFYRGVAGALGFTQLPTTLGGIAGAKMIGDAVPAGVGAGAEALSSTLGKLGEGLDSINDSLRSSTPKLANTGPQGELAPKIWNSTAPDEPPSLSQPMERPLPQVDGPTPTIPPALPVKDTVPALTTTIQPGNTESMQFAQDNGYLEPIHYTTQAKADIQANSKAAFDKSRSLYAEEERATAPGAHGADDVLENKPIFDRLQPFKDKQESLPEVFQDPVLKKIFKVLAPPEEQFGKYKGSVLGTSDKVLSEAAPSTNEQDLAYDWASAGEPDLPVAREVVAFGQRMNRLSRTTSNPMVRSAAYEAAQGAYDVLEKAPENIRAAAEASRTAYADAMGRFNNPTVLKFLDTSSDIAHRGIKTLDHVMDIQRASASALDNIRQAHGYDLANELFNADKPTTAWNEKFSKNSTFMKALYGDTGITKLGDAASSLEHGKALIENSNKSYAEQLENNKVDYHEAIKAKEMDYQERLKQAMEQHKNDTAHELSEFKRLAAEKQARYSELKAHYDREVQISHDAAEKLASAPRSLTTAEKIGKGTLRVVTPAVTTMLGAKLGGMLGVGPELSGLGGLGAGVVGQQLIGDFLKPGPVELPPRGTPGQ